MEIEGQKKPSLIKELIKTGIGLISAGTLVTYANYDLDKKMQNPSLYDSTSVSQREVVGKIPIIEKPTSEEISYAKTYAKKFLAYNEENIDSTLILERIKGYKKIIYVNTTGERVLRLDELNPSLTRDILEYSSLHNVNPKLMLTLAIIETKFGYDKKKSSAGAEGPFQVMPINILEYKSKTKNPLLESAFLLVKDYGKMLNIDVSYNSKLTQEEITLITAAYNAGITNLKSVPEKIFINPGWYLQTKKYSLYALSALNHYRYDTGLKDKNGNNILV